MARKTTASAQDDDRKQNNIVEEFEEIPVDDDIEADPIEPNEEEDITNLLAHPDKAVEIPTDDSEDKEEVMYCPNCGVTGLFVDMVCMNCGEKKGKKGLLGNDEDTDSTMDYQEDEGMSIEEY